jgi:hypothetical protein
MNLIRFTRQLNAAKKRERSGIDQEVDVRSKSAPDDRNRKTTPISEEVMAYYQRLLEEHNLSGHKTSRMEYKIL